MQTYKPPGGGDTSNLVTIDTPQVITSEKTFSVAPDVEDSATDYTAYVPQNVAHVTGDMYTSGILSATMAYREIMGELHFHGIFSWMNVAVTNGDVLQSTFFIDWPAQFTRKEGGAIYTAPYMYQGTAWMNSCGNIYGLNGVRIHIQYNAQEDRAAGGRSLYYRGSAVLDKS
ncbi:hypothetical protein [Flagellimonas algicola]|uniref:Virulence plasmid B protein n=1 Tax=Flagellimonas algicola TaxID=2583815 RepID=A0ABY2WP10_9FLAO|nr:hypothetical protein [Allomuricauda algicola]TMU56470.1 hypothetical protein FGG15_02725 [Allomuricauda algicola]